MDAAHSRSLGFAGKEILFRKIEFERYRKPHVVEYPRSAIVLNPQHTRQLRDSHHHNNNNGNGGSAGDDDGDAVHHRGESEDDDDDDDPRRIDGATQLCSDAQLHACLHLRWLTIAPVGLGLVNLGNTCFANSVVQALAHTPALAQYFTHTFRSADHQLGCPFDFAFALADTFRKMQPTQAQGRAGGGAHRPGALMSNLRLLSKHFAIGRQSDAHEFAVQLLFACQKSLLHRLVGSKTIQQRIAHTTALYRICGGYLLSQVTWSRQDEVQQLLRADKKQAAMDLKMEAKQTSVTAKMARHGLDAQTLHSNTYDPFTILSVELAGQTLQHCLDKFCAAEELDGRCYLTPREVGVRARKKFSIHVPPPVLVIHLKRFGPTGNKIHKHVQVPLELDIARYCTASSPSPPSPHRQQHATGSASPSSSASPAAAAAAAAAVRPDCQYELSAMCVHEGRSIDYGHYYTLAKASNGMWYTFNDSHVSRLSEDQLQRAQAYMLFYSRKPAAARTPSSAVAAAAAATTAAATVVRRGQAVGVAAAAAVVEQDGAVGRELSEREVQALLRKRAAAEERASTSNGGPASSPAPVKNGDDADTTDAAPQPPAQAARSHAFKRMREALPTESGSDDDDNGDGDRGGASVRLPRASLRRHDAVDEAAPAEDGVAAAPPQRSPAPSLYGGLIKSMKRASSQQQQQQHDPNYRVGRHAVQVLHSRKAANTPETVRRPTTAPKFQQRIRDPMWETAMDTGKTKKVKTTEKADDPFSGVNPFQEVSRGMFDIRGRRRRE
ncbi:ubiquitin carboxyl-terminal hydrolase [Novymonas esmeraldas]|uniref:Ubiquitin carboxyl-terminal hydrolase n=1 Tax=Novymonas esmeraldas TaxID=1808958 RepID=A0AAW0EM29_9TRYP